MYKKESYVVSAAIVVAVITMLFFPVTGIAADPAALSPIIQKLDQIPPTWSKTLSAAERFGLVLNGAAVLDKETGLVWEQSPSTTAIPWAVAQTHCNGLTTGGRLGWRLPTLQELASLVDTSIPSPGPTLPSGHPFSNVQPSNSMLPNYWSATTQIRGALDWAWGVNFYLGSLADVDGPGSTNKVSPNYVWCVRGGQGVDPQ